MTSTTGGEDGEGGEAEGARHEQHSSPTGRRPMPSGQMSIVQNAEAHASTVGGEGGLLRLAGANVAAFPM